MKFELPERDRQTKQLAKFHEDRITKRIHEFELQGLRIPDNFTVLSDDHGYLELRRPDGLRIFLSEADDLAINHIRVYASENDVILAIGLYRGMQISANYSKRYSNNSDYSNFFKVILKNVCKVKLLEDK